MRTNPSTNMKTISHILAALVASVQLWAAPMDDLTVIIWRKQVNEMSDTKKLAQKFEQLMDVIGKETAAYSKKRLAELKPGRFEDRIRLIALARVQHPDVFEEIFKIYVKHPSQEEVEKMRAAFMQSYTGNGNMSEDEVKKVKEGLAKLNREHTPPSTPWLPPPVEDKHLKEQFRYYFEYFWMTPPVMQAYRNYDGHMDYALDKIKEKAGEVDLRDLIKEKMKTFDPRKDPNFKLMEE